MDEVLFYFGTAISFTIRADADDAILPEITSWFEYVENTFSTFRSSSVISRLDSGELSLEDIDAPVQVVLQQCERIRDITFGAFNHERDLSKEHGIHSQKKKTTKLDPSGYVKGWAIQQAANILLHADIANFCINAGGDIICSGRDLHEKPWKIGIQHPTNDSIYALATTVTLHADQYPCAIATSGYAARGEHIGFPNNASSTSPRCISATVIGPDLGEADAFATALLVDGASGFSWLDSRPGYSGYIIDENNQTWWTQSFEQWKVSI